MSPGYCPTSKLKPKPLDHAGSQVLALFSKQELLERQTDCFEPPWSPQSLWHRLERSVVRACSGTSLRSN